MDPPDAIHQLLVYGREDFVGILVNRQNMGLVFFFVSSCVAKLHELGETVVLHARKPLSSPTSLSSSLLLDDPDADEDGDGIYDRVDADALPEILHAMASSAFAAFKNALGAIVADIPGCSLMGDCDPRTAVKSLARIRAKLQEYRAEEQKWPACARVQDPLRATILCSSSAVMLEALKKVEAPPFKLLRLKNNLASEKKPFNLHAVLEYTTKAVGVPLVVEVQLLFDDLLPLFEHTHNLYSVYRARSFAERHT